MGLDYDTLRALKPDIILTTVNAWASGGEWSHKVGFDGLAQAASGNLYLSGPPDQPSRAAVPYVDFSTATIAALSTLAALMHRRADRRGPADRGGAAAHGGDVEQPDAHRAGDAGRRPRLDATTAARPPARPTCIAPATAG